MSWLVCWRTVGLGPAEPGLILRDTRGSPLKGSGEEPREGTFWASGAVENLSRISDTQASSRVSRKPGWEEHTGRCGPICTLALHLTCVRKTPCRRRGGAWALGGAPGERVSRYPSGGGQLGQVLSRGGIPRPGGIIILIGVALGESGTWVESLPASGPCCCSRYPSRTFWSDSGCPTPFPVPVQVSPTSSSWSQLCWPHAPAGQSLREASIPLQPTSSSQMGPVPGP